MLDGSEESEINQAHNIFNQHLPMIRIIFIVVVLFLTLIAGLAVVLYHFYGWTGLIALPFLIAVMVWLAKVVITFLFKRFFQGLVGVKSGVLRDAVVVVHSITPVAKPAEPDSSTEEHVEEDENDVQAEPEEERHYFEFDMTITPAPDSKERVWEPGELLLTKVRVLKLEELGDDDKELGIVETYRIWKGETFVEDEDGKLPGLQRVKMTFAVKPGGSNGWLQYYDQSLHQVTLPEWKPE